MIFMMVNSDSFGDLGGLIMINDGKFSDYDDWGFP